MKPVSAKRALFIKLGRGGTWETECLKSSTLRFGYRTIPHELCVAGNWLEVERHCRELRTDQGAATRDVNQIRYFYEADDKVLWITFHSDRLWWCFSNRNVKVVAENAKERQTIGTWNDNNIHGEPLIKGKLSGKLLSVEGFMGTICTVSELEYLLHKINGTVEPHVAKAENAFENLQKALLPIIRALHHKDLEILTDLIFRQAGWQRVGVSGGTEKDIDLDLISPVTGERIAVQVKSKANLAVWSTYREKYADMRGFSRFYFVTHSPNNALIRAATEAGDTSFILWTAEQLAKQATRGGLTGWLIINHKV